MAELAIIKQENIATIVSLAPQSYSDNKMSCEKCLSAGQNLVKEIAANGMSDELDQQAAIFLEKARKTVRKMNERRAPVTKLFDDIRREFTVIENTIDPTKADTVPYKLQALRNEYAAKKRAAEEARIKEELARQQAAAALAQFKQDVEEDLKKQFGVMANGEVDKLFDKENNITLETFDAVQKEIEQCSCVLPDSWFDNLEARIIPPCNISIEELEKVQAETKAKLHDEFFGGYGEFMAEHVGILMERLPSKKATLERMAQANAEEAARIKHEMEEHQRKEAEALEAERKRKEDEECKKAELARSQTEMNSLFAAQASVQTYQPKVKVTKKIELLNPEGIMPIISMWWTKEGSSLTVAELSKMFKKQITLCEKLANKEGIIIEDESVDYVDDVKAK